MSTLLEICCGSIDDAIQAQAGGANRVELCSALWLGGLTASVGTMRVAGEKLGIPIIAMVRPRGGGFCYTEAEFATMEHDAEELINTGADGIVFGILDGEGEIDVRRTKRLREIAGERQAVFHRAFDVTPDPMRALEQLVDLRITRILTSGQENSVHEGAGLIRRLVDSAGSRIEIMPGGGIRPDSVSEVVAKTGCGAIHLTAFKTVEDHSTHARRQVTFGGGSVPAEDRFDMTDADLVRRIVERLR